MRHWVKVCCVAYCVLEHNVYATYSLMHEQFGILTLYLRTKSKNTILIKCVYGRYGWVECWCQKFDRKLAYGASTQAQWKYGQKLPEMLQNFQNLTHKSIKRLFAIKTIMSVLLTVMPKYTLTWWVTVTMPTGQTDRQTDGWTTDVTSRFPLDAISVIDVSVNSPRFAAYYQNVMTWLCRGLGLDLPSLR